MVRKLALYTLAIAASVGVFALYAHPQTMVAIADMMWACFN
jgi:hypothetical protein